MRCLHIVIPVFDEGSTLAECIKRIVVAPLPEDWQRRLILVDDHSQDMNEQMWVEIISQANQTENCAAMLIVHKVNQGKGAALRTGFDEVLNTAQPDDLVIIQDADLEYDPADYINLMQPLIDEEAQAVFGTRWNNQTPGNRPGNRSGNGLWRKMHLTGNKSLTWLSNLMTGYSVTDMECCYKLFYVATLKQVRPMLTEDRFGIEPQITACLSRLKVKLMEIPVSYSPRAFHSGKKIGWKDGLRALYVMMRERLR